MSLQRMDVSFVSVYQIYEFRGYVSNSLFHDKTFFLKFEFNSAYHTPLLYKIHLMSVEKMLEKFDAYEV